VLGYLNTKIGFATTNEWTTAKGGGALQVNWNVFQYCRIPDYEWYKEHKPEQVKTYLQWIETNMTNKDTFLAQIDNQFNQLIN